MSQLDDAEVNNALCTGFEQIKAHTGKNWVSITDAINYFYTCRTKTTALPSFYISYILLKKHGTGLDATTGHSGLADKLTKALSEKFHNLEDDLEI